MLGGGLRTMMAQSREVGENHPAAFASMFSSELTKDSSPAPIVTTELANIDGPRRFARRFALCPKFAAKLLEIQSSP
jgi:hypothetical protein